MSFLYSGNAIGVSKTEEILWDENDLSNFLNKSKRTIQGFRYLGIGPKFVKLGKSIRYRPSDVREWIEKNIRENTGAL